MTKGRGRPPAKRKLRSARGGGSRGGAGKVLLGVLLGAAAVAGAGYLYLHTPLQKDGDSRRSVPPEAPSVVKETRPPQPKRPATTEGTGVVVPGIAEKQPPFGPSEDVFEAAAWVYRQRCASCHGTVRGDAAGAKGQRAVQLFREGRRKAGDQTPGQVFAAINLGAQGLGMPAYHGILTEQQIWQVVLLLRSAAEPLPDPVAAIVDGK